MAEDGAVTIASAVVVPGTSPDRPTKRRTSSATLDGTKRPRLDSFSGDTAADQPIEENGNETNEGGGGERAPQRRRLGISAVEEQERKRGQRLFGALLGTIGKFQQDSQSARAKAGANRRLEIEKKLQQKLKQQNEELDEKRRKENDLLREKMAEEQKLFEERSMHLRHTNLRSQANFLCTKSRPPLYYLPWKLTPEEEDIIKQQIEDTEALIERELSEFEAKRAKEGDVRKNRPSDDNDGDIPMDQDSAATANHTEDHSITQHHDDGGDVQMIDDHTDAVKDVHDSPVIPSNSDASTNIIHDDKERDRRPAEEDDKGRPDIHDGVDDIVEAGEDTVIY